MNISKSPIDHRRPSSPDYPQPHGPAPPVANGSDGKADEKADSRSPVKKRKRIDRQDQEYENGHRERGLQRTVDYSPPLDPSPVSPRTMIGTMALSSLAEAVSQVKPECFSWLQLILPRRAAYLANQDTQLARSFHATNQEQRERGGQGQWQ